MRKATVDDRPALETFLAAHASHLMFAWSNLQRYGMEGGHPRAMSFWMNNGAQMTDLIGISDEGIVMPYCPAQIDQAVGIVKGRPVLGLLGDSRVVLAMRDRLGLGSAGLDTIEPHFDLDLADLRMPDVSGLSLHPLERAPRDVLEDWRRAYSIESLAMPGADAAAKAVKDIDNYIAQDTHRVLYDANQPVAMTGFNATAPAIVQVGGVYTPPPLRARGYARAALALHLAEVRAAGVKRATLFAANAPAARAYRGIGFQHIGEFAVIIYDTPQNA